MTNENTELLLRSIARYFLSDEPTAHLENGELDEVAISALAIDIQHGIKSWIDSYIRRLR